MVKELIIDEYFDGYKSKELNCIDLPLAACLGYFERDYYFFYCIIYCFYVNWMGKYDESWLSTRQNILKFLNIDMKEKNTELLQSIKDSIKSNSPTLMIVKYGSLPYSAYYKTGLYDHGVIICGYDENIGTYIVRDREVVRQYINSDLWNSDVLFRLQISDKELEQIISESYRLNSGNSKICGKIYTFRNKEKCMVDAKTVINSIKNCAVTSSSSLISYIEYRNVMTERGSLYSKEIIEADRRRFSKVFQLFCKACSRYFYISEQTKQCFEAFISNREALIDRIQLSFMRGETVLITDLKLELTDDKRKFLELLSGITEE